MLICQYVLLDGHYCDAPCEGRTNFCGTHNRLIRKEQVNAIKSAEKRKALISKPKKVYKAPSKDPKDWSNTFLCSDGTKVTEANVINKLRRAYSRSAYVEQGICLGCGEPAQGHAHIISKRRCKLKGKTELIWRQENFFEACNKCNSAIENPKGEEWKTLRNIDRCIQFIYEHDKELYFKFEAQGWQAKIKENEKI